MNNITLGIFIFLFVSQCYAQSSFGNIGSINQRGKISIKLEGANLTDGETVSAKSTLHATIGSDSFPFAITESTSSYKQETVGVGIAYAVTDQLEVFGGIADGKQTQEGDIRSDDLSSYKLGIRFVPSQQHRLKMGIIVQAEKVDSKYTGGYQVPYIYNSTTSYSIFGPVNGEENVSLTSFDVEVGFSLPFDVVTPYFGIFANSITGDYSFSAQDNTTVQSCPRTGGSCSPATTEDVSLKLDSTLKENDMFGGVLGISFQTMDNFHVDVEYQAGARKGFFFLANYTF